MNDDYIKTLTAEDKFEEVKITGPAWYPEKDRTGGNLWLERCPRLRRKVHLSSDIERDFWLTLIFNPRVAWYCEHAPEISFPVNGQIVVTIFDFLIQWVDGSWSLREVKDAELIDSQKIDTRTKNQLDAQEGWSRVYGVDYEVVKNTKIRENPLYLENLNQILPYLRTHRGQLARDLSAPLFARLAHMDSVPLQVLEESLAPDNPQAVRRLICYYLMTGELVAPLMTEPFTRNILIKNGRKTS